jgi:hypothetical protein
MARIDPYRLPSRSRRIPRHERATAVARGGIDLLAHDVPGGLNEGGIRDWNANEHTTTGYGTRARWSWPYLKGTTGAVALATSNGDASATATPTQVSSSGRKALGAGPDRGLRLDPAPRESPKRGFAAQREPLELHTLRGAGGAAVGCHEVQPRHDADEAIGARLAGIAPEHALTAQRRGVELGPVHASGAGRARVRGGALGVRQALIGAEHVLTNRELISSCCSPGAVDSSAVVSVLHASVSSMYQHVFRFPGAGFLQIPVWESSAPRRGTHERLGRAGAPGA